MSRFTIAAVSSIANGGCSTYQAEPPSPISSAAKETTTSVRREPGSVSTRRASPATPQTMAATPEALSSAPLWIASSPAARAPTMTTSRARSPAPGSTPITFEMVASVVSTSTRPETSSVGISTDRGR